MYSHQLISGDEDEEINGCPHLTLIESENESFCCSNSRGLARLTDEGFKFWFAGDF